MVDTEQPARFDVCAVCGVGIVWIEPDPGPVNASHGWWCHMQDGPDEHIAYPAPVQRVVSDPAELDALPLKAIIVDRDSDAWQHRDDGTIDYGHGAQFDAPPGWFLARPGQGYDVVRSSASMAHFGPFTVAWLP